MRRGDGGSYDRIKWWKWYGKEYPLDLRLITVQDERTVRLGLKTLDSPETEFEWSVMDLTWRNPEFEAFLRQIATKIHEVGYAPFYRAKGCRVTRLVIPLEGVAQVEVDGKTVPMAYQLTTGDCVHLLTGSKYKHRNHCYHCASCMDYNQNMGLPHTCYYYRREYQDRDAELFKSPPGHTVVLIQPNGPGAKERYGLFHKGDSLYDKKMSKKYSRNGKERKTGGRVHRKRVPIEDA